MPLEQEMEITPKPVYFPSKLQAINEFLLSETLT